MKDITKYQGVIPAFYACYDEKGKTLFKNGKQIAKKRNHYKQLRRHLQLTNTRSSKRRIRKIGQRENRWMSDYNHCLSKTLVKQYGKHTLFVLEDLTNVTFDTGILVKGNLHFLLP